MDISQNVNYIERQKRIRKRKRKIVRRLILLQLAFLALASHYAQAEIVGIIKYYLLEVGASIFILYILVCLKERGSKEEDEYIGINLNQLNEMKQQDTKVYKYNYNWVIKDTSKIKEVEQEQKEETKEEIKQEAKEQEKQTKITYQSPFDAPLVTPKKVKYRSPFDPINKPSVILELDSAKDDFCYSLSTKLKYKYKTYKKQVHELEDLLSKDVTQLDVHEINERAKLILAGIKQARQNAKINMYKEPSVFSTPKIYTIKSKDIANNTDTEYKQEGFEIINKESCEEEQEYDKLDEKDEDELLRRAIEMVLDYEQASISFIQRKLKVGYEKAARILEQMEDWGIVAKAQGSEARQILTTKQEWLELNT